MTPPENQPTLIITRLHIILIKFYELIVITYLDIVPLQK